jgi:hypothetical protein
MIVEKSEVVAVKSDLLVEVGIPARRKVKGDRRGRHT